MIGHDGPTRNERAKAASLVGCKQSRAEYEEEVADSRESPADGEQHGGQGGVRVVSAVDFEPSGSCAEVFRLLISR
jgi:hypothetical protein